MEEEREKAGDGSPDSGRRKVVLSGEVDVTFSSSAGDETERVPRDVFSVMDAVTARLARTKSKEEMESVRVSVRSVEDEGKSDPPPEGEAREAIPYLVGGAEIEGMPIPEAMEALAKCVLPGRSCMSAVESLCEQFFLRSRADLCFFVATFDGVPASVPMATSMRDVTPVSAASAYRALLGQAEGFRSWYSDRYPDRKVGWDQVPPDGEIADAAAEEARKRAEALVLPSGLPASMAQGGVKTPEEIRRAGPRVVHLT